MRGIRYSIGKGNNLRRLLPLRFFGMLFFKSFIFAAIFFGISSLYSDELSDAVARAEIAINQRYAFTELARNVALRRLKSIIDGKESDSDKIAEIDARFINVKVPLEPFGVREMLLNGEFASMKQLAEGGNADAQYKLGMFYLADREYREAVEWFQRSAGMGYIPSQIALAQCYELGHGVGQNAGMARKLYRKAADLGSYDAQFLLGNFYEKNQKAKDAVKWYSKAALQGLAQAQFALGLCHYRGSGVPQNYAEAAKWFNAAAQQNNADAQNYLGMCFYFGYGVSVSYYEAVRLYGLAAQQGNVAAAFNLASCYENGIGIQKNLDAARRWYQYADANGDKFAASALERVKDLLKKESENKE